MIILATFKYNSSDDNIILKKYIWDTILTFSAHRKYNALIQPLMSTQKQFLFKLVTRQYI